MKTRAGIVDPVTLSLVALVALAAGVFGTSWKPLEFLKPKPPTAELTKLQDQLTQSQAETVAARKAKDDAIAAERAKSDAQVRAVQQEAVGAALAAGRIAPQYQVAEVKLTARMVNRVNVKLVAIIGELPKDQQEAMATLIDQSLSEKQAEVDSANAKLAQRDADYATLTKEHDAVKAQIPVLTAQAVKAEEATKGVQTQVTVKTNQVKAIAMALDAKEREAGSLGSALESTFHAVVGVLIVAGILGGIALYLRSGLGSVGRALGGLQKIMPADEYAKVVNAMDAETDKLHQFLIATARKATS